MEAELKSAVLMALDCHSAILIGAKIGSVLRQLIFECRLILT